MGVLFSSAAYAVASVSEDVNHAAPASVDVEEKPALFDEKDNRISVFVSVSCDDPALETAIRVVAQDRLRSIGHINIVESMEDAAVLLSFSAFRAKSEEREQIIYSFAFGAPDTDIVDDEPVSLPRYIYHEAAAARPDELASSIDEKVRMADANFIRLLQ
jgi:hypothetical protein